MLAEPEAGVRGSPDWQTPKGAPSSEHSKVDRLVGREGERRRRSRRPCPTGRSSIVTTGAVRSATSHSNWAGRKLALPSLIACTSKVYSPSARSSYVCGDVQVCHVVPDALTGQAALERAAGLVGAELERRRPALVLDVRGRRCLVRGAGLDRRDRPGEDRPGVDGRRGVEDAGVGDRPDAERVLAEQRVELVRRVARAPRRAVEPALELGRALEACRWSR